MSGFMKYGINARLELGGYRIYHLAEKKRFTALYRRVLWRSWSYFADSWNNAKICLNYGVSFPSISKRKQSCGYMDNSPLRSELPTYPQHYCYYFFIFKNKRRNELTEKPYSG